jgi:ABC-type Fe3+/spermidine/putrescine transport system ATPase subunit
MVEADAEGATMRLFGQTIHSNQRPQEAGSHASVVLRPEALRIERSNGHGVPARVLSLAFIGPIARYTVLVEDGTELIVDLSNPGPDDFFEEGTEVRLQLPAEISALLE